MNNFLGKILKRNLVWFFFPFRVQLSNQEIPKNPARPLEVISTPCVGGEKNDQTIYPKLLNTALI